MTTDPSPPQAAYRDDELVYIDPDSRSVIGPIEWSRNGNPKSLPVPIPPKETEEKKGRRRNERKYFPWGTYRSMKHAFNLEGKQKRISEGIPIDEAIARSQQNII